MSVPPPTHSLLLRQLQLFFLLYLAYVSSYITRKPFGNCKSFYKALPDYARHHGSHDTMISIVDTAFALPYALSSIFLAKQILNDSGRWSHLLPKTVLAAATAGSALVEK